MSCSLRPAAAGDPGGGARLGAQLLMQAALEAEVTEFLGRDRYQRAAACEDARPGAATATGT